MSDNNNFPPDILKGLNVVTLLMQNVLSDIREHSTSLAIVRTKLEDLSGNVEVLSHIIRDGNGQGSMITRLALAEKALEDTEEQINELKDGITTSIKEIRQSVDSGPKKTEEENKKLQREKTIAKFQFWGALLAAFAALGFQLFGMLYK